MDEVEQLKQRIKELEQQLKPQNNPPKEKILITCKWYVQSGRRCRNRGLREGYCFMHENNFKYNPKGITNTEGYKEPCTNNTVKKFIPSSIKQLDDVFLGELTYHYKNQKYFIDEIRDTYAVLKLKDKFVEDVLMVWDSKEDKKQCKGILVSQIYAFRQFECEERASVDIGDGNFYCVDCFEYNYKTLINSIN